MSLPYMGSKRRIVSGIYKTIKSRHPEANILVDPFCGGFSVSEYFMARGFYIIASDYDKYVVALLNKILSGGLKERDISKFVTRELFERVKSRPDLYENWYVGYVGAVWSFGNQGGQYIYGRGVEGYKRAAHDLIVNADGKSISKIKDVPPSVVSMVLRQPNRHIRRRAAKSASQQVPSVSKYLNRLEHLERIERVEAMPTGPEVLCKDYSEVEIPDGAIVYCDPPYKGTAEYRVDGFDSDKFWAWARKVGRTNPVYVSEYSAPDDFEAVFTSDIQSQLGPQSKTVTEKLFTIKS